ncbi:MAG: hypothetical protein QXD69_01875 [Candidatus Bathyarchaeia archaeon]
MRRVRRVLESGGVEYEYLGGEVGGPLHGFWVTSVGWCILRGVACSLVWICIFFHRY